jgi:hypothetical protein
VYFNVTRNDTVDIKEKELKARSSGYRKQHVTAMLPTADSHKLSTYIILSRKTIPKDEMLPKNLIVRAQKWMEQLI